MIAGRVRAPLHSRRGALAWLPVYLGFVYTYHRKCDSCGCRERRRTGLYGRIGPYGAFIARRPE